MAAVGSHCHFLPSLYETRPPWRGVVSGEGVLDNWLKVTKFLRMLFEMSELGIIETTDMGGWKVL